MSGASDRCAERQTCCRPGDQSRGAVEVLRVLVGLAREEEGQDLVEYALLITFIALACIVGMQQLGTAINNNYNSISASVAS
jgi:Flp pilus assembly pilin Flp